MIMRLSGSLSRNCSRRLRTSASWPSAPMAAKWRQPPRVRCRMLSLMDLNMPRMSGLQATRELLAAQPQARVVILSGDVAAGSADEAMALGVAGFLLKEDDPCDLPERIRAVAAGGTAWSTARGREAHEPRAASAPVSLRLPVEGLPGSPPSPGTRTNAFRAGQRTHGGPSRRRSPPQGHRGHVGRPTLPAQLRPEPGGRPLEVFGWQRRCRSELHRLRVTKCRGLATASSRLSHHRAG